MVTDPSLLLADEPTGNLDSSRKLEIMQLLRTLNQERDITIVVVTHERDVANFASRTVTFRDGRIEKDERGAAA